MANFFVVVVAMMAVSSWAGGGEFIVAAQGSPVVFRDEFPPMPEVISKNPPPCLSHNTVGGDLCVDDPEYNDTIKYHVKRLLSRDRGVNALLSDPSLRGILNDVIKPPKDDMIGTRFGGDTGTPVCVAQETLIYPKRGKTQNNEWVFVLNQEDVQQALRVETCLNEGSSCSLVMPKDAKAICRQKHAYRRLLVLGTNKIEPQEVLMPSCCVCYTTYEGLATRTGISNTIFVECPPLATPQPAAVDTHPGISAPLTSGPTPSPSTGFVYSRAMHRPISRAERRPDRYRSFFSP